MGQSGNGTRTITVAQFLSWLYDCVEFEGLEGEHAAWEFSQEFGFHPGYPDQDLSETDLVVKLGPNRFRITVEKLK